MRAGFVFRVICLNCLSQATLTTACVPQSNCSAQLPHWNGRFACLLWSGFMVPTLSSQLCDTSTVYYVLPERLRGIAGATTTQSLAVLKKNGHISFVLNENIDYLKLTAG